MSTRTTRRGTAHPIINQIPKEKDETERPARSKKNKNAANEAAYCANVPEEKQNRRTLREKTDNVDNSHVSKIKPPTARNTRSRKESVDTVTTVEIANVRRGQNKKKPLALTDLVEVPVSDSKLPVKVCARKSKRNKKDSSIIEIVLRKSLSEQLTQVNKENEIIPDSESTILTKKKTSKRNKTKVINTTFNTVDESLDAKLSLPSQRGSTDGASVAPRTRRGARSNSGPSEVVTDQPVTMKGKGKKKSSSKSPVVVEKSQNLSSVSNETSYHSVIGGPEYPIKENKYDSSFSSAKGFDISDSKHSSFTKKSKKSKSIDSQQSAKNTSFASTTRAKAESSLNDRSQIHNETFPLLIDDSILSDQESSFQKKSSSTIINISSKDNSLNNASGFMTRSKNNLRISGIEEILPGSIPETRKSLRREGTYTKDNTFTVPGVNSTFNKTHNDSSHNQSSFSRRHVFSAASPCKLFPRQSSTSDKSTASTNNSTFTKSSPSKILPRKSSLADRNNTTRNTLTFATPLKNICRAFSVGSAGRTPMPPLEKSLRKSNRIEENSTPVKTAPMLNLTHSLEKPKEEKTNAVKMSEASTNKAKSKVGFSRLHKIQTFNLPNAGKIIKSNLKGSNKSFMITQSVSKPGTRNRSAAVNDAETRGTKIHKLASKELAAIGSRLANPKTPVSAGKHLYAGKVNASIASLACTPAKSGVKPAGPVSRSKMPDFASLHKRQFAQMESLVQNKARKMERAKELLFSKTLTDLPKSTGKTPAKDKPSGFTFAKDTAEVGFTRFGFKLQVELPKVVPKAIPVPKPKSSSKVEARKAVLREEKMSVVEKKRLENRNYVRGVRTNRRFELQMQSRNMAT